MNSLISNKSKYRWFYTYSGKLVIGGKNALQNEQLLHEIVATKKEFLVMHTSEPGSPFSIILSDTKNITKQDREECAIFTACFSRAWRAKKKKAAVDVFYSSQLFKEKNMSVGTWGVKSKIERLIVPLRLVLTIQNGTIRAVPPSATKEVIRVLAPGRIDKQDIPLKIELDIDQNFPLEEVLSALPAGGSKLTKK